jgi:transcriptional regulator with XRE-family HTH domain
MSLSTLLQSRVNELEMSISDLARRSGVSRATVIRILGGKDEHYSVSNLQAVLSALGMKMDLLAIPAKEFKDSIATQKAQRLIALTQGNVALESQAVSSSFCPRASRSHQGANRIVQSKALGFLKSLKISGSLP